MIDDDDIKFWAIIFVVIFAIICFAVFVMKMECKTYGEVTGREVKLEFGTCYAKMDKGWFAINQVRNID